MDEKIVRQIEQVLAMDALNAPDFSRILFGPGGLFNKLAPLPGAERTAVATSALFRRATEKLLELARTDTTAVRRPLADPPSKPNGAQEPPRTA